MTTRILVAYASGSGSTAEVAEVIGAVLRETGATVDVENVEDIVNLQPYGAVVLGSSIRAGRWLPEATDFLLRFRAPLSQRTVAYFVTCLTLVEKTEKNRCTVLSYLDPLLRLAPEVEPIDLGLFAGSLDPQRTLLMQTDLAPQGDYRDWQQIRAWAGRVRLKLVTTLHIEQGPLDLSGAILSHTDLSHLDLEAYDLQQADLHAARLEGSRLAQADLNDANLVESDLAGADLTEAMLGWADLQRSNLSQATLAGANLIGANLQQANLAASNLSQAILNGANLRYADLRHADLSHADLSWTDLTGADLSNANLAGANLVWTNFSGATLTGVNFEGARYNGQTQWPEKRVPDGELVAVGLF
jgi:uncharacterized protein YjbI with pentapeptide repeats/menaquinone-dependent protoporphyrinogen IX oxidase